MKFKTIVNSCMVCGKKTRQPNPFYICKDCRKLEITLKELTEKYVSNPELMYVAYDMKNGNLIEIFKRILETHIVPRNYIVKMLDEMDKMPEWNFSPYKENKDGD